MTETQRLARQLIEAIREGLRRGLKYRSKAGKPLNTEVDVLRAMLVDGEIDFDDAAFEAEKKLCEEERQPVGRYDFCPDGCDNDNAHE